MIPVNDIFLAVTLDRVVTAQNGDLTYEQFTRNSQIAELRLLDWLTGDVSGVQPPAPYTTQKVKDWASFLLTPATANVQNGVYERPADYYLFESMTLLNGTLQQDCETGIQTKVQQKDPSIEILDTQVYADRMNTYVKRLKPSLKNPFAQEVGTTFEFCIPDIGGIRLLYYRYPKFAQIVSKPDPDFNDVVYDPVNSVDYQWPIFAKDSLIWFIVDVFADGTREQALKKTNQETGKSPRG